MLNDDLMENLLDDFLSLVQETLAEGEMPERKIIHWIQGIVAASSMDTAFRNAILNYEPLDFQ